MRNTAKALKVTNLGKFEPIRFDGCLGQCEYFTARKYVINDKMALFADESSFQCVTCVSGNGFIEEMEIKQGDSFFIPAGYGNYRLIGNLEILLICV